MKIKFVNTQKNKGTVSPKRTLLVFGYKVDMMLKKRDEKYHDFEK